MPREDGHAHLLLLNRLHPYYLEVVRMAALVHVRMRHTPEALQRPHTSTHITAAGQQKRKRNTKKKKKHTNEQKTKHGK